MGKNEAHLGGRSLWPGHSPSIFDPLDQKFCRWRSMVRESLDISPPTGGNNINQNIKTETSNAGTADDSLDEAERLAQAMFERIWQQIQRRASGRLEYQQAVRAMIAEVRWAEPDILYLSWARPYDEARTALHRELRDTGIKLSRMSELLTSSEAPKQPIRQLNFSR